MAFTIKGQRPFFWFSFFMEDLSRKSWCEKLQIIPIPLMQKRDVSGQKTAREESTSHLDMKEVEDLPGRDWRERGHSGAPTTWHQASVSPGCCPRDASATVAVWQSLFWMVAFPSGNPFKKNANPLSGKGRGLTYYPPANSNSSWPYA